MMKLVVLLLLGLAGTGYAAADPIEELYPKYSSNHKELLTSIRRKYRVSTRLLGYIYVEGHGPQMHSVTSGWCEVRCMKNVMNMDLEDLDSCIRHFCFGRVINVDYHSKSCDFCLIVTGCSEREWGAERKCWHNSDLLLDELVRSSGEHHYGLDMALHTEASLKKSLALAKSARVLCPGLPAMECTGWFKSARKYFNRWDYQDLCRVMRELEVFKAARAQEDKGNEKHSRMWVEGIIKAARAKEMKECRDGEKHNDAIKTSTGTPIKQGSRVRTKEGFVGVVERVFGKDVSIRLDGGMLVVRDKSQLLLLTPLRPELRRAVSRR